jgi:hypothetical protein
MKAGLNGNKHREWVHDLEGALTDLGVTYLGDGEWEMPDGAEIECMGGDDWILTMTDGTKYHVWSEED